MSPRTYLARFAVFGAVFGIIVIALNWLVDPYAVFGTRRLAGLNQYKIDINNFTRLSKRYQARQAQYSALIVGNSRVELGINPAHACFRDQGWRVYNMGLPGAGIRTQVEYALNIMHQQPVERVFFSLDFTDFIAASPLLIDTGPALFDEQRNRLEYLPDGERNPDYLWVLAEDYYKSLFTLGALSSSVITVVGQSPRGPDRDESGFNPARDFAEAVRLEGPNALFSQKMDELRRKYSRPWYLRDSAGRLDRSFEDIADFLGIAAARRVEVVFFTSPFHVSYWQLMEQQGLMPLYADWLDAIERLVLEQRGGAVSLWDFSQDSPYIHESVPRGGVKSGSLKWFWEPAHYKQELGDLMVEAMLSDRCGTQIVLGRKLR
jgi:hypothetical protein